MNFFIKTGRVFYASALLVYGGQQFYFGNFRNVLFPPWQQELPLLSFWAWVFGLYLAGSAIAILFSWKGRNISLILGGVLLAIFLLAQIPYELISEPNKTYHFGLWVPALKEWALSGGAFVMAGSFTPESHGRPPSALLIRSLARIIPYGNLFFAITMASFGAGHFMYTASVARLVPAWFPDPVFWTCFAGIALIGAGTGIILQIRLRPIALLLSIMIFLWFWLLHLPGGLADPLIDRGNNLASAFDALAFSGIALIIAFSQRGQKWIDDLEDLKRVDKPARTGIDQLINEI